VIVIPFLLVMSMPTSVIKVDGYFFDWDRAGYFKEGTVAGDPSIDLIEYSVVTWQSGIYGYISTESRMFQGGNGTPTAFYAMIDMDNNPDTGYSADGIGADKMVEILGWNGSARSADVYIFPTRANRSDFNSFVLEQDAQVANSGNQLEFSFVARGNENPTVRFLSKSCLGCQDESGYAVSYQKPAVRATVTYVMPEIVLPSMRESIMTIKLESQRGDVMLRGLNFENLGTAMDYQLFLYDKGESVAQSMGPNISIEPAIEVKEGYGKILYLSGLISDDYITETFGLALSPERVLIDDGTIVVNEIQRTAAKTAYILSAPDHVVIDGAFADWANGYVTQDSPNDVKFANGTIGPDMSIDILEYGLYSDGTDVSMYWAVADKIYNGTLIPKNISLPVPSAGLPSFETPELLGADVAGAVLDTDLDIETGANVSGLLGADFLVLVSGKRGKVLYSDLYAWKGAQSNGEWMRLDSVRFGIDNRRMELAFNSSYLNMSALDMAAVGFFMTDWKEGGDFSDSILPLAMWETNLYSRAFGGILINEVYNVRNELGWIELYNTGTEPISLSGWVLYDGRTAIYYFGDIVLEPGEFLVISDLPFTKLIDLILVDNQGIVQDEVKLAESKSPRSWSRTGSPPYNRWHWTTPTPGDLNEGQVPIPEFSSVIIPILAIIGIFILLRRKRRRVNDDGQ